MKIITTRPNGTRRVSTKFEDKSMADQSQKDACDINKIIARYNKTGQLTHVRKNQGLYTELAEVPDLIQAYDKITLASEAFEALPAELRKKLHNDPLNLINFLNDPANDSEAIKYGLKEQKVIEGIPASSSTVPSAEQTSVSASVASQK